MEQQWNPCDRWWQFYWLWLKVALTTFLSWADAAASIVGVLLPLLHAFVPKVREDRLVPLYWEIPIGVFCAIGILRMVIAPYLIYRDRHLSASSNETAFGATISDLRARLAHPPRTPAEQHAYDIVKNALAVVKDDGIIALRHLKFQGTFVDGMYRSSSPPGLTPDKTVWVYQHCSSVGIVSGSPNVGGSEITYRISLDPAMLKALDDLLFPPE
jgi:hypothetical protein